MDPVFKNTFISPGELTVSTEGLYRVIYHGGIEGEDYTNDELLNAEDAIEMASIQNEEHAEGGTNLWAEVISYEDWEERAKEQREQESHERYHEQKLKEMADQQAATEAPADECSGPEIKVLETESGTARVSTAGLFRVLIQPGWDLITTRKRGCDGSALLGNAEASKASE